MLKVCIEGVILGFGLSFIFGPAFFALLQTSLERGFAPAVRLAFGIFVSDLFLVAIAFLGAARLFENETTRHIVSIVGGLTIIGMGLYTFFKKVDLQKTFLLSKEMSISNSWKYVAKGFFMNIANPATWIFWIFWVGIIAARYTTIDAEYGIHKVFVFFTCALLTVLCADTFKAFIANKIKRLITSSTVSIINKIVGIVLIVFGAYLVLNLFLNINIAPDGAMMPF